MQNGYLNVNLIFRYILTSNAVSGQGGGSLAFFMAFLVLWTAITFLCIVLRVVVVTFEDGAFWGFAFLSIVPRGTEWRRLISEGGLGFTDFCKENHEVAHIAFKFMVVEVSTVYRLL